MESIANPVICRLLLEQMVTWLRPVLRRSVTSIGAYHDGKMFQCGTGTFFRVADVSFLVTAGHVWEQSSLNNLDLFVFSPCGSVEGGRQMRAIPLTGNLHWSRDPADIAVFELDNTVVDKLKTSLFLRCNEVMLRPAIPGWCWLFGFPSELCQDDISTFRFKELLLGAPFNYRDVSLENYQPALHFLLNVDRNNLCLLDGTFAELPIHLNGLSGCPIWQTVWPNQNLNTNWDSAYARIVGVQTSYYSVSSIIKATPWAAVANIIYQRKKDLRKVLELHFGPSK